MTLSPHTSWEVAWAGAAALGVVNGALREALIRPRLTEREAQRVSTAALVALLTLYMAWLQWRRPIPRSSEAWLIGAEWGALTIAFEFALGRVRGRSWDDLSESYDPRGGNWWPAIPAWMALGPSATRWLRNVSRAG